MNGSLFNKIAVVIIPLLASTLMHAAATTPNPGLKYYYPAPEAPVVDVVADVVVYGGTSGGVVAAVQAVRMGKTAVLVVFGRHVGGTTSGGLSETDGVNAGVQGGITREFFSKTGGSRFKPSEAEQAFEELLADPVPGATWDAPVPTYYEQRLDWVEKDGAKIVALHMENGSVYRGKMFIDCSYEGELMARAGVTYTFGKENTTDYGESLAGRGNPWTLNGVNAYTVPGDPSSGLIYNVVDEPQGAAGTGYNQLQAYNFRMYTVQAADPAARRPLFEPQVYDPDTFEILYRFHRAGGSTSMSVGNDINNHEMFGGLVSTDHIGGNRWPDGQGGWISWADADYPTRELIYQSHVAWQLGMLWYLKTDTRYRALATDPALSDTVRNNIQSLINKVDQLGLPLGEYPETDGWPHELYVREARRMVSDFVLTQDHFQIKTVVPDSVGLANYVSDSHNVRRFLGPGGSVKVDGGGGGGSSVPWRIAYRALTPPKAECENLLVPWSISATSVAFCSMRMEPCFMVLSQSAATAAALCIDRAEAVQDLPYGLLRLHLLADGQILGEEAVPEVGVIVDDADLSGFSTTGLWTASASTGGYYGSGYLHDGNVGGGCTAVFEPDLPEAGTYEVYGRWTSHSNRASNVAVDIVHQGGTSTLVVNQRTNGGIWYSLGEYTFDAGTGGRVVIRNDGADGYVIADAVSFVARSGAHGAVAGIIEADPAADEADGSPARLQIVRDNADLGYSMTVHLAVSGTAVAGTHYTAIPASVTIPVGKTAVSLAVNPLPDNLAQGDRSVVVSLVPDDAYLPGDQVTATAIIRDKPYDGWRHREFAALGLENAPESLPEADFDADGLPNLIEFVLGSNPVSGRMEHLPRLRVSGDQLEFEYWHRGEASSFAVIPEFSETLESDGWAGFPQNATTIQYDPATGDRFLRAVISRQEHARLMCRLRVQE